MNVPLIAEDRYPLVEMSDDMTLDVDRAAILRFDAETPRRKRAPMDTVDAERGTALESGARLTINVEPGLHRLLLAHRYLEHSLSLVHPDIPGLVPVDALVDPREVGQSYIYLDEQPSQSFFKYFVAERPGTLLGVGDQRSER